MQLQQARVRITIGDRSIEATLADSDAARDFASLLPLTLAMNDLFRREKFATLPRAISEQGKRTHDYAWDHRLLAAGPDVAIFYRQDGERIPDPGLIVLGKIKAGDGSSRLCRAPSARLSNCREQRVRDMENERKAISDSWRSSFLYAVRSGGHE